MRKIVEAAKVLEGELYPTASSVIPFLDTVCDDLQQPCEKVQGGPANRYVSNLLLNLRSSKRFPDGYKEKSPYNILTLLDPRYADLYFEEQQLVKAFNELFIDPIYDNLQDEAPTSPPISAIQLKEEEEEPQDSLALRRAAFLARKTNNSTANPVAGINTVKRKLKKELDRFLKLVERKPESLPTTGQVLEGSQFLPSNLYLSRASLQYGRAHFSAFQVILHDLLSSTFCMTYFRLHFAFHNNFSSLSYPAK